MALTFSLTSEPTPVTESGWPNGALIYNTGTADAYAAEDPGGQVTGFPVPAAGGSLTWDADRPLYLSAGAGHTTTVVVDDNSSSTVSSPTDLANAIIAAGLASDIAQQVNVMGVPPIDAPVELVTYTGTINGLRTFLGNLAPIDVSRYQSVRAYVNISDISAGNDTIQSLLFGFADDRAASFQRIVYTEGYGECSITGDFPVLGQYLFPQFDQATQVNYLTVSYVLYGSYRTADKPRWQIANHLWFASFEDAAPAKDCATSYAVNTSVAPSSSETLYPSWQTGTMFFAWWTTGPNAGGSYVGLLTDGKPGHYLAGGVLTTGVPASSQQYGPIVIANRQPVIEINSHNTVATNYDLALAFID